MVVATGTEGRAWKDTRWEKRTKISDSLQRNIKTVRPSSALEWLGVASAAQLEKNLLGQTLAPSSFFCAGT
ncbi:hypothetical protein RRG08_011139 [Elysia crispata]|uniref:Uncharacterized protein n=1 Tax=Elysia crispata TaxID=231223 RepID=A0AAE1DR10_9GAST|nr:hypothetical protein RRG08_011139 [Elysia crispata]